MAVVSAQLKRSREYGDDRDGKATGQRVYLVRCDSQTTTQDDVDRGRVNILVGFAPLKPAEYVVIQIQQLAGETPA